MSYIKFPIILLNFKVFLFHYLIPANFILHFIFPILFILKVLNCFHSFFMNFTIVSEDFHSLQIKLIINFFKELKQLKIINYYL